uniref:DNA primase AEP n=1 Tax=Oncorhynchus mykiss TaxID=8022 RepID=A0A8C7TIA6_ONCMY
DDIYVRYQSFSTQSKLEEAMQKMDPYKIDIGAVYCHWPNQHNTVKSGSFQALEKELVFDIDMTDYNDVRSCCTAADICPKYWTLMTIALCILDRALRGESKEKKGDLIYALVGQDILSSKEAADKVLALVKELLQCFQTEKTLRSTTAKGHYFEKEIMWQYCYPWVDVNVSKGVNHLLKSPFSVHPKTGKGKTNEVSTTPFLNYPYFPKGRISVPIDLRELDPLSQFFIIRTLDLILFCSLHVDLTNKKRSGSIDYKRTSLGKYVKLLDEFLEGMARSRKGEYLKKSDLQKDF